LVAGFVVACLTLAALGVFELTTGHANRGISGAAVIEVALSLWLSCQSHAPEKPTFETEISAGC
jgi:hypothetical protein